MRTCLLIPVALACLLFATAGPGSAADHGPVSYGPHGSFDPGIGLFVSDGWTYAEGPQTGGSVNFTMTCQFKVCCQHNGSGTSGPTCDCPPTAACGAKLTQIVFTVTFKKTTGSGTYTRQFTCGPTTACTPCVSASYSVTGSLPGGTGASYRPTQVQVNSSRLACVCCDGGVVFVDAATPSQPEGVFHEFGDTDPVPFEPLPGTDSDPNGIDWN